MKNNRILIIAILAILVFAAVIFYLKNSKPQKRDLAQIIESGRISVVTDSSSMGFSLKKDSVYGFQFEIIKMFADSLGVELQISEQNDLNKSIDGLASGEYDIVANIVPFTSEFKNKVNFSKTIINTRQVFVQKILSDSLSQRKINKQIDLANDTIYIPLNSPYKMRIKHLSDEIASRIYIVEIKNISTETLVRMVSEGRLKNTICSEELAKKLQKHYPNIDISLALGFNQNHGWLVNVHSPKLLEKLNAFLSDFMGSTAYWELYRKYN